MWQALVTKIKSIAATLGALIAGLAVLKLIWDKVNANDVLKGNTEVLNNVAVIEQKKQDIDEQLKSEENKRNEKKETLTNDELANFFNKGKK